MLFQEMMEELKADLYLLNQLKVLSFMVST
jgi:hypothetical protein